MPEINTILATDCGSTTTKAILIEKLDGVYHLIVRGEAPTTVEAPFDDVTVGVINAVREVEELSGRKILKNGLISVPSDEKTGVDLYLSTSSAGGGLQMTVAGVVKSMSAESAERAALGAGAIIIDTISVDDGRKDFEKVQRIRELRPDMILMSGGTDGGTVVHLVEIAEMLLSADPKPRLGTGLKLPVIYAGNKDAASAVSDVLADKVDLKVVDNLRPTLDRENLHPAREAIHELFLQHVMQQAPGYGKLMTWASKGIMSTPNAVGKIIETIAEQNKINVLAVDIGGATTDVFSVFNGVYTRTVSANLGMSYSICNVMAEAGIENIKRWIPFESANIRNELRNKMVRPTTIPQTLNDLYLEQAVAREALRLAFIHHKSLARELKGVQQVRTIGDALSQDTTGKTLVNMMDLDMIVGSGGVLSHAPLRQQSAFMMLDAYQPEGITALAVDSIFMMPQLGILSTIMPQAASEVFNSDCLVKLGTCIAPVGTGKTGGLVCRVEIDGESIDVKYGSIQVLPMAVGEKKTVKIYPSKSFNVGSGKGREHTAEIEGGIVGVIIDGRGRPFQMAADDADRISKLREWYNAFGLEI